MRLPITQGNKDREVLRIVHLAKKACNDISNDLGYLKI